MEFDILLILGFLCAGTAGWAIDRIHKRWGEERLAVSILLSLLVALLAWYLTAWLVYKQGEADLFFSFLCFGPTAAVLAGTALALILAIVAEIGDSPRPETGEREDSDNGRVVWSPSTGFTIKRSREQGEDDSPDNQEPGELKH